MFIKISLYEHGQNPVHIFTNQDQGESFSSRRKTPDRNQPLCVYQLE
jgi:hypothetical protein